MNKRKTNIRHIFFWASNFRTVTTLSVLDTGYLFPQHIEYLKSSQEKNKPTATILDSSYSLSACFSYFHLSLSGVLSVCRPSFFTFSISRIYWRAVWDIVRVGEWQIDFLSQFSFLHTCTYSVRYCQPILLLAATVVAASSNNGSQYLKLYVQLCAPDDGRRNRLKHVEHL